MKIKLIAMIGLWVTSVCSLVYGFERIESEEEALSKEVGVIYVIGEEHNREEDMYQKKVLMESADAGDIILGLEGTNQEGGPDAMVFGLEEPFLHHASVSFGNLVDLFVHIACKKVITIANLPNGDDIYSGMVNFSERKHLMKLVLGNFREYLLMVSLEKKDSKEQSFIEMQIRKKNEVLINLVKELQEDEDQFDNYDGAIYRHLGRNTLNDNFFDNLSRNDNEWFVLIKRIGQYFVQNISDKEMQKRLNSLLTRLTEFYKEIEKAKNISEIEIIMERLIKIKSEEIDAVTLDVRNAIFLKTIQRAYREKEHLKKPFFIIVGSNHVAFLRQELEGLGFEVAVNDGVYDYSGKVEL